MVLSAEARSERNAALKWGAAAVVSTSLLVGALGAEGAVGFLTAGLGFFAEAAAFPELGTLDAILGIATIVTINRTHYHYSRYRHFKAGGTAETHRHTPIMKHPGFGARNA